MPETMPHVLKANSVQLADPLQLSLSPEAAPKAKPSCSASQPAQIRIAENHPEYAVLEVTCSCGQTTYVRCEYAAAPA
jgi:hypothetical protein